MSTWLCSPINIIIAQGLGKEVTNTFTASLADVVYSQMGKNSILI